MKKILIIPARRHILEAYCEYIIRYLGNEFYFEMGYPPVPPYHNLKGRILKMEENPLFKNPDAFDLIYQDFTTHFFLEPPEKYYHKMVLAFLEPGTYQEPMAAIAGTSKPVENGFSNFPHHSLRFGVDTELFKPFPMVRTDDLLHVGFIGAVLTPRRYMKELFIEALKDVKGIRLMIFPTTWPNHMRPDEVDSMGGGKVLESIVDGDKWLSGLPNLYNQMDIFIRCDINNGYQFSVMEAGACGIPVITCDPGLGKDFCDESGGGIYVDNGTGGWEPENLAKIAKGIREAVIELRDDPGLRELMGKQARTWIERNWTWDKFIPAWREFFKEGLTNAM